MSIIPIITFKAGKCDLDQSSRPHKVKAQPQPGYIYLYAEDDLIHFCWRPRNVPLDDPELDLVMVPTDGRFVPYEKGSDQTSAKTSGRIFALKFGSSSQRHLFWLQSKPQGRSGDPSWFSPRDNKIGDIVDRLLQGEEVDVNRELAQVQNNTDDSKRDDDDQTMEDVEGTATLASTIRIRLAARGPMLPVATSEEKAKMPGKEGPMGLERRASSSAPDAAEVVRNLLASLQGQQLGQGSGPRQTQEADKLYPLLSDLLEASLTVPMVESSTEEYVDNLLNFLPPTILVLAHQGVDGDTISAEPSADSVAAAKAAMSVQQKKALLVKVLRSPQFHQSLSSLTMALRDGGLPTVADALGIQVENGGFLQGGAMPLGGGAAVEAFVEGVKKSVQKGK